METDAQSHEPPVISVVVCTYNHADILRGCLETLEAQQLDHGLWEVLVMDNNSTDATPRYAAEFCGARPNFRYLPVVPWEDAAALGLENLERSLSKSRNAGLAAARGEYIAYVDDDTRIPPQWLSRVYDIILGKSPAACGGPYRAFYISRPPAWFKDDYGSHSYGEKARALRSNEFLHGMNIIFHRELLSELGGFDESVGETGRRKAYGDEIVPQQAIRRADPAAVIWYDPGLWLEHLVAPDKMRWPVIVRYSLAVGESCAQVFDQEKDRQALQREASSKLPGFLARLALEATWGLIRRDRQRFPVWQHYFYEHIRPQITHLGELRHRARGG